VQPPPPAPPTAPPAPAHALIRWSPAQAPTGDSSRARASVRVPLSLPGWRFAASGSPPATVLSLPRASRWRPSACFPLRAALTGWCSTGRGLGLPACPAGIFPSAPVGGGRIDVTRSPTRRSRLASCSSVSGAVLPAVVSSLRASWWRHRFTLGRYCQLASCCSGLELLGYPVIPRLAGAKGQLCLGLDCGASPWSQERACSRLAAGMPNGCAHMPRSSLVFR
jgi:hypothetical protein